MMLVEALGRRARGPGRTPSCRRLQTQQVAWAQKQRQWTLPSIKSLQTEKRTTRALVWVWELVLWRAQELVRTRVLAVMVNQK